MSLQFARIELLGLLVLIPGWWLIARASRRSGVTFPRTGNAAVLSHGHRSAAPLAALPRMLRAAAFASLVVVLAGPVLVLRGATVEREEIAIVLVVDLSSSMLAQDMEKGRTRIQVARETAVRFLRIRPDDRIGLVAFAGEAFTRVPPTDDLDVIVASVERLDAGMLQDGTDISGAIAAATNRLIAQPHNTKVAILLTDGAHNARGVTPFAAAQAAAAHDVKIYAISILGSPTDSTTSEPSSELAIQQRTELTREIETVLTQVARVTNGRYFHVSGGAALDSVYRQIDRLETTSVALIEETETKPAHVWFLLAGLLLLCAEATATGSRYGTVP